MRRINPFDTFAQDVRFAVRQLRKHLAFTCAAIFMLALGLCATVAIFAFVDAALLKPLPYRDPSRLLGVYEAIPMFSRSNLSYQDYVDWKQRNTAFSSLEAYQGTGFILTASAGAEAVHAARVTDGFFRTLGVAPILGRDFGAGEDLPSAQRTVILSYGGWQKRYGGRQDIIGQSVTLNGDPTVIIGVLPPGFHFAPAEPSDFWVAMHADRPCELRRSCHNLYGIGRLKDGVSMETALANVTAIAKQLEAEYPDSNRGQGAAVAPLSEVIVGNIRPILLLLLSGAGLLLLIASVNAASLLLVRSESRTREMAVRRALGASRARLLAQFVTEAVMLVSAGTAIGLVTAHWAMRLLTALIPEPMIARMPYLEGLGVNGRVLVFAAGIALFAALLFAITPALRLSASDSQADLAEGSRGSAGRAWRRLGSRLVVVELAIAVVLLAGAGLLGKSLYHLMRVDVGFNPDHLATLQVGVPQQKYPDDAHLVAMQREIVRRVSSLPGVESVGISGVIPLSHNGNTSWIRVVGRPWHGEHNDTPQRDVTANYFKTLGAKLVRGRYFAEDEDASKPLVAIVNQAFVRQHFPNEDAVGKRIVYLRQDNNPIEIVGIVENIREGPLDVSIPPVLYVPFNQSTDSSFGLIVRTAQDEASILPTLAAAIREMDPAIVTDGAMTMRDRMESSNAAYLHRSSAWLVGAFAAIALLLGIVGLYGVIAYSVSQRRREIGVRMALGADRRTVSQLVLREAGWLTALGVIIGVALAIPAAILMRDMLFAVRSWDVPTLAAVALLLGVCALAAAYIPARRAASVNPVEALRAE